MWRSDPWNFLPWPQYSKGGQNGYITGVEYKELCWRGKRNSSSKKLRW
jgi:hypothetical protein